MRVFEPELSERDHTPAMCHEFVTELASEVDRVNPHDVDMARRVAIFAEDDRFAVLDDVRVLSVQFDDFHRNNISVHHSHRLPVRARVAFRSASNTAGGTG